MLNEKETYQLATDIVLFLHGRGYINPEDTLPASILTATNMLDQVGYVELVNSMIDGNLMSGLYKEKALHAIYDMIEMYGAEGSPAEYALEVYSMNGASQCPNPLCGSKNISAGAIEADGMFATSRVRCGDCGSEWVDGWMQILAEDFDIRNEKE